VLLAPGEEAITGRPEALPERLGPGARHRADRLPLGLQPPDRVGGLDPFGRVGERGDALAQGLLGFQVGRLLLRLARQVGVATRADELVRLRVTLPDGFGSGLARPS